LIEVQQKGNESDRFESAANATVERRGDITTCYIVEKAEVILPILLSPLD